MKKRMILLMLLMTLPAITCNDGVTPPSIPQRIALTLIDVSVTETFLHIAVQNSAANETLHLQRDGVTVMVLPAVGDTMIVDTALTQTTTYQYAARLVADNTITGTSNAIMAETLAPTSHEFTWETFLLGDGNGSSLYDVAIVRADAESVLVYAVGELYLSGDHTPYNLAKWDGQSWQLLRVQFYTICGQSSRTPYPAKSVFAFGPGDVWIAMDGSQVARWNGTSQTATICMDDPFVVNTIWGESPNSIWAVGYGGRIGHYTSGTWRRIESGTTTHILDAHGVLNPVTERIEVYCAVTDWWQPQDKRILRITDGTTVDSIRWDTGWGIASVWTNNGFPLYAAGDWLFENGRGVWRQVNYGALISVERVRGTGLNDIWIAGPLGLVAHYNGVDWRIFTGLSNAAYSGLHLTDQVVVLAGGLNGRGVVTIGRRN